MVLQNCCRWVTLLICLSSLMPSQLSTSRYTCFASPSDRVIISRRSATARLLRLWVWIPPGKRMSVCCDCYVVSGRGLCEELITRPEESYRLWCVVVCDLETSWMGRPWPTGGCCTKRKYTSFLKLCKFTVVLCLSWWHCSCELVRMD